MTRTRYYGSRATVSEAGASMTIGSIGVAAIVARRMSVRATIVIVGCNRVWVHEAIIGHAARGGAARGQCSFCFNRVISELVVVREPQKRGAQSSEGLISLSG